MSQSISSGTIEVKGDSITDAFARQEVLQHLQNIATTEELQKLKLMTSEKGRKALKNKWALIKTFI